MVVYLSWYTGP